MQRKARKDELGALHHVIVTGIDRRKLLCQEDIYLKELVRYNQLNPFRTGNVDALKALDLYTWCGHSVLMNKTEQSYQNIELG